MTCGSDGRSNPTGTLLPVDHVRSPPRFPQDQLLHVGRLRFLCHDLRERSRNTRAGYGDRGHTRSRPHDLPWPLNRSRAPRGKPLFFFPHRLPHSTNAAAALVFLHFCPRTAILPPAPSLLPITAAVQKTTPSSHLHHRTRFHLLHLRFDLLDPIFISSSPRGGAPRSFSPPAPWLPARSPSSSKARRRWR